MLKLQSKVWPIVMVLSCALGGCALNGTNDGQQTNGLSSDIELSSDVESASSPDLSSDIEGPTTTDGRIINHCSGCSGILGYSDGTFGVTFPPKYQPDYDRGQLAAFDADGRILTDFQWIEVSWIANTASESPGQSGIGRWDIHNQDVITFPEIASAEITFVSGGQTYSVTLNVAATTASTN